MALDSEKSFIFGTERICGVIAAPTAREMLAQIRNASRHTQTLELRLDWLKNDMEVAALLAGVHALRSHATLIATCRRREAGGRFEGSVAAQLARLSAACAVGCQWCDLEIETAFRLDLSKLRRLFKTSRLLVSFHDFRGTPPGLKRTLRQLEATGADAVKMATECRSIADSLRVLKVARGRRDVVAVPMGEAGFSARVLALRRGNALAYASVGPATAPGQASLEEMKRLYRADRLSRSTKVYGVIGNPVAHSLSPLLHNTGYVQCGMDAVYLPFFVRDLRDFLDAIEPLGIRGFSVTLPHKERILRHLDGCDPLAEKIGAVNTVTVKGGKLYGSNTDWRGIGEPLARRLRVPGSRILIFGAGGAARTAAFALANSGAIAVICARRAERAHRLARLVGGEAMARRHLKQERFDAMINATPVGMIPHADESPLEARELNCRIVFDMVYRPLRTKLLRLAARRGIKTISGVEMFMAQGLAQWNHWFGTPPPETAMRDAVLRALQKEETATQ